MRFSVAIFKLDESVTGYLRDDAEKTEPPWFLFLRRTYSKLGFELKKKKTQLASLDTFSSFHLLELRQSPMPFVGFEEHCAFLHDTRLLVSK